eukprot:jgi/Ulvmu1/201/UM001_0205.1
MAGVPSRSAEALTTSSLTRIGSHKIPSAQKAEALRTVPCARSIAKSSCERQQGGRPGLGRAHLRQAADKMFNRKAVPNRLQAVRDVYKGQTPGWLKEILDKAQLRAQSAWCAYERILDEKPIQAKALTSGVGLTVADVIAQAMEGGSYDATRTARMASFGLLWHGVSSHIWYEFLDAKVPGPSSAAGSVVTKMVLDQAIWAPLNTMIFYSYLAAATGALAGLPMVLQTKLIPTILAGYALWPVAHIINFRFVPPQHRLLYVNLVNLVWTVWLSGMANNSGPVDPALDGHRWSRMTPIPVSNPAPSVPRIVHI